MVFKEKNIAEKKGLPLWGWAVGAALVATVIVLGYRTVQTEQRFNVLASEFHSAEDNAAELRAIAKSLQLKLDRAESGGVESNLELREIAESLQLKLDSAKRELQKLNEVANEHERQIAMLRQGKANCEEFFDGWSVQASPPTLVTLFGIAREATAAMDCIDKGDTATACRHWEGLLLQIEKVGSPLTESRDEIETLIRQHGCK
jgi:hypothetical protein